MMRRYLATYWAFYILHMTVDGGFLSSDNSLLNLDPEPIDELSQIWYEQDPSSIPPPTARTEYLFSGDVSSACLSGTSSTDFLGKRGSEASTGTCPNDDAETENSIKDIEWPWSADWSDLNDDAAAKGELQLDELCPDLIRVGNVIPVCSSGYPQDVSFFVAGEATLKWCALGTEQLS